MLKPLLYTPPPRWQIWAFLGGALVIHGIAVVAAIKHEPPAIDLSNIPDAVVIGLDQAPPDIVPTPPPEEPEAPPPPPPPTSEPEFKEEQATPPPKKQTVKVQPIARPQVTGTLSASGAKAAAIFAPKPEYPYEARSKRMTGSGVCVVTVDPGTGAVTDATMAQSIGNPILDNSALSAFRRWRFKPGAVSKAKIPVTYTMTGASY